MGKWTSCRRWLICGVIVILCGIALLVIGRYRRAWYDMHDNFYRPMAVVGTQALEYSRTTGTAPASVRELVDAGFLRLDHPDSGAARAGVPTVAAHVLSDITLSFPKSSAGYEIRDGRIVDVRTGQDLVVIYSPKVWSGLASGFNRRIAVKWFVEANKRAAP